MNRVLAAYATRRGSTREVAAWVADDLRAAGHQVDQMPVSKVKTVDGYDMVILGTAIRGEKPLPEAVRFARRFANSRGAAFALFAVCLTMNEDTPESRRRVRGWLEPIAKHLQPVAVGLFPGAAEKERLGFFLSAVLRRILAEEGKALGDYRDRAAVDRWVEELARRPGAPATGRRIVDLERPPET